MTQSRRSFAILIVSALIAISSIAWALESSNNVESVKAVPSILEMDSVTPAVEGNDKYFIDLESVGCSAKAALQRHYKDDNDCMICCMGTTCRCC